MINNTNALSCSVSHSVTAAATRVLTDTSKSNYRQPNVMILSLSKCLRTSPEKLTGRKWCHPPLVRFRQLWTQLKLVDGVLCHVYTPGPTSDVLTVTVMPHSLQQQALQHSDNDRSVGHQGADKTLVRSLLGQHAPRCGEALS